jgi:hypothetical protein
VIRDSADIADFIQSRPEMVRLLTAVESLQLPDSWIGAGFIRNAVWEALTLKKGAACSDVDVIYFDANDRGAERDAAVEIALRRGWPDIRWAVKNQARMNERNADSPYRDSADAIAHWPETATAIAARWRCGRVEVIAPYGVADLVGLIVRPTPAFADKLDLYRARVERKGWRARWPELAILDAP